jgi:hypothetical protein
MVCFPLITGSDLTSGTSPDGTWQGYSNANAWAGQTVTNLGDSTSNYINFTGVQLEVGDTATPFEHRPYDMELARCQRYFQVWRSTDSVYTPLASGQNTSTTANYVVYQLIQEMRAAPTVSFSSAGTFMLIASGGSGLLGTGISASQATKYSLQIIGNVSSGLTIGYGGAIFSNNTTSAYVLISAEL